MMTARASLESRVKQVTQLLLHVQVGFLSISSFPTVKCVLVFLLCEVFLKNSKKEKKQLIDVAQELKIVLRISSNLSTEF